MYYIHIYIRFVKKNILQDPTNQPTKKKKNGPRFFEFFSRGGTERSQPGTPSNRGPGPPLPGMSGVGGFPGTPGGWLLLWLVNQPPRSTYHPQK